MSDIENNWLQALTREIAGLPTDVREDIVRDYREHFSAAREAGRTDIEIANKLGEARAIGRGHAATERIAAVEKSVSVVSRSWGLVGVVKALLILAPLNFFIVLGPFVFACAVLLAGWFAAGVATSVFAVLLVNSFASAFHLGMGIALGLSGFLLVVAGCAGAILLIMIMWIITAWFLRLALAYCKWNVRFVTGQGDSHV